MKAPASRAASAVARRLRTASSAWSRLVPGTDPAGAFGGPAITFTEPGRPLSLIATAAVPPTPRNARIATTAAAAGSQRRRRVPGDGGSGAPGDAYWPGIAGGAYGD